MALLSEMTHMNRPLDETQQSTQVKLIELNRNVWSKQKPIKACLRLSVSVSEAIHSI